MKTYSSDLFDLIKSLSNHEKKCYIEGAKKSDFAYINLFRIVSKSHEFNEDSYLQKLKESGFNINNYTRIKNYLYNDVLQFLVQEESKKKSIQQTLRETTDSIRILIERALIRPAEKLLKKSKIQALKYNLYSSYSELLHLEYQIIRSKVHASEILNSVQNLRKDLMHLTEFYSQYLNIRITELETYQTIM